MAKEEGLASNLPPSHIFTSTGVETRAERIEAERPVMNAKVDRALDVVLWLGRPKPTLPTVNKSR